MNSTFFLLFFKFPFQFKYFYFTFILFSLIRLYSEILIYLSSKYTLSLFRCVTSKCGTSGKVIQSMFPESNRFYSFKTYPT
jgi:hypothetical protein